MRPPAVFFFPLLHLLPAKSLRPADRRGEKAVYLFNSLGAHVRTASESVRSFTKAEVGISDRVSNR